MNEKDLDLTDLTFIVSQMVQKMLRGEEIEKEEVTVTVKVWKPVIDAIKNVSELTGADSNMAIAELVQEGLNSKLQSGFQQHQPQKEKEQPQVDLNLDNAMKDLGFDQFGKLTEGLNKFAGVMSQLQDMQKMFENINAPTDNNNPEKNNK